MRILITGGLGFQGTHLTRALSGDGHEVTILNSLSPESLKNGTKVDSGRVVWGSITDSEVVHKTVRNHDLVFNLAANIHVDESILEPGHYVETNIKGTYNVLESCRKYNVPLIHVSTCEVYGGSSQPLTEDFPLYPRSPYAASKAAADSLCYSYSVTYGLPVVILRPANVFGPLQRGGNRGALIPRFTTIAMKGEPLTIYGSGLQSRSFIYIEDLIRAYQHTLEMFYGLTHPQVYNVSSGEEVSVNQVAQLICKCLDKTVVPISHTPCRPGEVESFNLDSTKFNQTGFATKYSFKEGLSKYVEWRKENEPTSLSVS